MKKSIRIISSFLALFILCFALVACTEEPKKTTEEAPETAVQTESEKESAEESIAKEGVWKDALYVKDTTLGEGKTKFNFTVTADGKSVDFALSTDKGNLADALLELKLIEGEDGAYGLYVKKVNGITADYDVDQSWWGLNVNGESSMSGASGVTVEAGAHYEFIYSK